MKPYIFNLETTKIELHFEKSEYTALSDEQKSDLKSAFLWSRAGECWVSRAKEPNLWKAKQVAAKLGFTEKQREGEQETTITKTMLRSRLQQGHTLNDLLAFGPGQDCEIFKADKFYLGDVVIYVPDVALNHIPLSCQITDPEELEEVLSQCYTGQDFIDECSGDAEMAERLFYYCDWQHPSSAIDELADDEEES